MVILKHTGPNAVEGNIEDVCEDTFPEHPVRYVVKTSSFPWVNFGQSLPGVHYRQTKCLVGGSSPYVASRHICIFNYYTEQILTSNINTKPINGLMQSLSSNTVPRHYKLSSSTYTVYSTENR